MGGNISGTKSVDCMYAFGCWARRCWAHVGKEAKLKIDSFAKFMVFEELIKLQSDIFWTWVTRLGIHVLLHVCKNAGVTTCMYSRDSNHWF